MKIALYSDLHHEFSWHELPFSRLDLSATEADIIILAGDIHTHVQGLEWAKTTFVEGRNVPPVVVYVAGNHEYYKDNLKLLTELQDPYWKQSGVHFLENDVLKLEGMRILGCTLWSGFNLYGESRIEACMAEAERCMNDFEMISIANGNSLEPENVLALHQASVQWLECMLSEPFEGKTVVVTHFAPHPGCVAPQYQGSDLSAYFVNDLSWIMDKHRIDLWCFGHTHTNCDFIAENGCRVISNQLGYPSESKLGFLPELIIDL